MAGDDFRDIAPWAPGRVSLYSFLHERESALRSGDVHCALPCDHLRKTIQLPFQELILCRDVFAAVVPPAVEDVNGNVELAPVLLDLMEKTVRHRDLQSGIALYQILISDWRWHFQTLTRLEEALRGSTLLDHPSTHPYFLWLLLNAPDIHAVKFSLFMLRQTGPPPPRHIVATFGLHDLFSGFASETIAASYPDSEDMLIDIAKTHEGWGRVHALDALVSVSKPENRTWLLREGYKNRVLGIYTAYSAAVHGDLIGRLRQDRLEFDELIDLAGILREMIMPGGPSVLDLDDYLDGPEACRLLFEHCARQSHDNRLFWAVVAIVDFAETGYINEPPGRAPVWTNEVCHDIAARGRTYLTGPGWPPDVVERWLDIYGNKKPTVDRLDGGDLTRFDDVLQAAVEALDLEPVIEWAIQFLGLDGDAASQLARRSELEQTRMPGVCTGGIYGLSDPALSSVYGQIVLQVLQAMVKVPGGGWEIVRAALASETRFHRLAAAEALAKWPPEALDSGVIEALAAARLGCEDNATIAAIDGATSRAGSSSGIAPE